MKKSTIGGVMLFIYWLLMIYSTITQDQTSLFWLSIFLPPVAFIFAFIGNVIRVLFGDIFALFDVAWLVLAMFLVVNDDKE